MKGVTAVIADDEENLRLGIAKLLEQLWPELSLAGEADNGTEALALIQSASPDIVFLDIQMPAMTGIEVARRVSGFCRVVFITAYDQYAVQAFESEAVDYLLKPVTPERLMKTISRLKKDLDTKGRDDDTDLRLQKVIKVLENRHSPDYLRLVKVKSGTDIRFIPVSRVLFFKAEDKYTIVQTAEHEFLIKTPVKVLETMLDPKQFWRVHRSSMVNIDKIKTIKRSFTNQMIIVFHHTDHTVAVSRAYEHLFKQM